MPQLRKIPLAAIGGVIPLLMFVGYNFMQYGTLLTTGYGFDNDSSLQTGISVSMGFSQHYTPADAFRNTLNILYKFNGALFGWPVSLIFLIAFLLPSYWNRRTAACLSGIIFIIAFFFFYSYPAYEYEARFWILLTPMCAALTAETIRKLYAARFAPAAVGLVCAMFLFAAFDYWPHYIVPHYAEDYEQVGIEIDQMANEQLELPALVLIDSTGEHDFRYSSGFIFNDPELERPVIYARDGDQHLRACMAQSYTNRNIYAYEPGDTWGNGSFLRIH